MIARAYKRPASEFSRLLDDIVSVIEPEWWLVSFIDRTSLTRTAPTDAHTATEGRAFGRGSEFRWRLEEDVVWSFVICDAGDAGLPEGEGADLTLDAVPPSTWIDLWGEWHSTDNSWREGRFRNPFDYEVAGTTDGDRVQIETRRLLPRDGSPPLVAFRDVRALQADGGT